MTKTKPTLLLVVACLFAALLTACDQSKEHENRTLKAVIANGPKWINVTIKKDAVTASGRAELSMLIGSIEESSNREEAARVAWTAAQGSPKLFYFIEADMEAKLLKRYEDNSILFYSEKHPFQYFIGTPQAIKGEAE